MICGKAFPFSLFEFHFLKVSQSKIVMPDESTTAFSFLPPCVTVCVYEPVTKGRDLKWDTPPQNQTPSKLFSVLPLESGMFQVTISIIKKWF